MSIELARGEDVDRLALELGALRAELGIRDAGPAAIKVFAMVCRSLRLDPFAGQIVLVGRFDSKLGATAYRHQITVDGRLVIAARTGRLRGIDGPLWTAPRNADGALDWREVWDEDGPPYAARALVYVDGWDRPANGTAKWSEFAQTDRGGKLLPTWEQMPSHMLGKVALAMALRRGFSEVQVAVDWPGPQVAEVGFEADDAAMISEVEANDSEVMRGRHTPLPEDTASVAQLRLIDALLDRLDLMLDDVARQSTFVTDPITLAELTAEQARAVLDWLKDEARRRATTP